MVWWSNRPDIRAVKDGHSIEKECQRCENFCAHNFFKSKSGIGFGNPLTGKIWVSTRTEWLFVCSICENYLLIEKEEAERMIASQSNKQNQNPSNPRSTRPNDAAAAGGPKVYKESRSCSKCGQEVSSSSKFCGFCGMPLTF